MILTLINNTMKVKDKIRHKNTNKQGRIIELIGLNGVSCLAQIKWFDNSISIEDLNDIALLPEQELINSIKLQPSRILKLIIAIKCWFIIFWIAKMERNDQKWINRALVLIVSYFLVRTLIG